MRRSILVALKGFATLAVIILVMSPVAASAQQTVNFTIGGFVPRGEDSRSNDDVLVNNRDFLSFDINDFHGVTVGGEWLTNLGDKFEAGFGLGYYQQTSPAVYTRFVNADGSEIEQDLKLRIIPFTATVRFLPLGHHGIEPYVGGGVGVFNWRYSETGQFLATDRSIFVDSFVGSGNATGPVILGGVRVPVGSWGVGGELRYQKAEGKMPLDQDFSGSRIDLGGLTYNFTIHFRF